MDKVLETFWRIFEQPDEYLSDRSIWMLSSFLTGYSTRMSMENVESALDHLYGDFRVWLNDHFSIQNSSQSVYHIIDSYSTGSENSFETFYMLFGKFYKEPSIHPRVTDLGPAYAQKRDLFELIRLFRQKPDLYLGYPHFSGAYSYLSGFQRAGRDLTLPASSEEVFYEEFKTWIERVKFPVGKPRPWFKLIQFYSFHDCGTSKSSAYAVFFELLDEFAEAKTRKDLFSIITH